MTGWKFAMECPQCSAYVAVADATDGPTAAIKFPDVVAEHECPRCGSSWQCLASAAIVVSADRCAVQEDY
jgi:ribosomal protein S27AE